ncbi:MAG: LacI family DNA-binding transcriptional regulator [Clostridiales bacterium]|nr:LacI family DNA-binding transcriptional regulator [Clostridiales bacterium]
MATIKELSIKCGVSVSTVSKALNGYKDIGDETKRNILKVAHEIGYFPDANARALKLKKTYNLGVLFSTLFNHGLRNEYFAHILASFNEYATSRGYDINFIEHNIGNRKMSFLEHCRYRNFDGVCIACADFFDKEVLEVVNSKIPVVVIDHIYNDAISILSDNMEGMKQLTQYIIDLGHKDIAYIHGTNSSVTHNRLVSFYQVLQENNITIPKEYVVEGIYRDADTAGVLAQRLLDLPKPPTCIMAPDDYSALGVMNTARRNNLRVPDDISVVGYDGITLAQALEPKLTTIRQDTDKIGTEAARQLINLIENPMSTSIRNLFLKVQLIKGESVADLTKQYKPMKTVGRT